MPEKRTLERARKDKREGKAPSTQAGEFIREEFDHIRAGKHGARSTKQAIAIGLSKARKAGVKLPPPAKGTVSEATRRGAARAYREGQSNGHHAPTPKRSRATLNALKHEGRQAASHTAIARHSKTAARQHTAAERSASARKAARTRASH